jgi:hypothetical protein
VLGSVDLFERRAMGCRVAVVRQGCQSRANF